MLTALNWANDLCKLVHRTRRMDLLGKKAIALIVCSCIEVLVVNVKLDEEIPGQRCARCRLKLPSVRWVPGHLGGEYAHEMPTMFETRRALQDAQGQLRSFRFRLTERSLRRGRPPRLIRSRSGSNGLFQN